MRLEVDSNSSLIESDLNLIVTSDVLEVLGLIQSYLSVSGEIEQVP